jgi:hypothetical protein
MTTIYLRLTQEFNEGRLRCILSSGQAVVLHRLAVMSKDGDWIVRENEDDLAHVRRVLQEHGARYRMGAPLDVRWLAGGWSSHFEFNEEFRVRADFVSRPPRLAPDDLQQLWHEQETQWQQHNVPVIDKRRLVELKKTNREKDYAVIGDLARTLTDVREQFLTSRSARDLIELAREHPALAAELAIQRPVLSSIAAGRDNLETALDAERRALIRANEKRLAGYSSAGKNWFAAWPALERRLSGMPLNEAHELMVSEGVNLLPFRPEVTS